MSSYLRIAFFLVCSAAGAGAQGLLVSPFDKPIPETRRDLLTIQQAAREVTKRAIPCTVALQMGGAMGSGIVISEDGYVLTAAHVVGRAGRDNIEVRFPDGRVAKARSLGMHTSADGALVKIKGDGPWPFIPLIEDGQRPEVGDWCLALGHPGGFDKDRDPPVRLGRVVDVKSTVLRTDCPITPGDSGGPLLDMQGRVIGIHSRITESLTENYHVPALAYREAWDALMQGQLYPAPIASRFLTILDKNQDGQLTKGELKSEYHRRVFDRLVQEFDLDVKEIGIDEVASEKFKWKKATQAKIVEIDELRDLDDVALSSHDFVRGNRMERLFENTLHHADDITVRVYADGRRVALGTIVDRDGFVLTKASRLDHQNIACQLSDGRRLPAKLIATDDGYDIALLRVNATDLTAPDWADSPLRAGTWVSIPNTAGRLESIGVVGVPPRKIPVMQPYLGVSTDPEVVSEALVQNVVDRSGAARAGIKAGDVVIEVAGKSVASAGEIRNTLMKYRAGDTVSVVVKRHEERVEVEVLLLSQADIFFNWDQWRMSGRLSRRRDGFESAFQIDAIVEPQLCGGPVVDVNGRILGVTLARADRVASYAIGHEDLLPILDRLQRQAAVMQTKAKPAPEVE